MKNIFPKVFALISLASFAGFLSGCDRVTTLDELQGCRFTYYFVNGDITEPDDRMELSFECDADNQAYSSEEDLALDMSVNGIPFELESYRVASLIGPGTKLYRWVAEIAAGGVHELRLSDGIEEVVVQLEDFEYSRRFSREQAGGFTPLKNHFTICRDSEDVYFGEYNVEYRCVIIDEIE